MEAPVDCSACSCSAGHTSANRVRRVTVRSNPRNAVASVTCRIVRQRRMHEVNGNCLYSSNLRVMSDDRRYNGDFQD
jgi:hypothetical protein